MVPGDRVIQQLKDELNSTLAVWKSGVQPKILMKPETTVNTEDVDFMADHMEFSETHLIG